MPERFTASRAAKHMSCHASANLEAAIPGYTPPVVDRTKGAKATGTAIHEAFDATDGMATKDLEKFIEALTYYHSVKKQRRFKELSEYEVTADWLQTKPPTIIDRVLYLQDELHIFDWKTGKIPVDAFMNDQLLYGARSVVDLAPQAKGVHLHIVQPWADNMVEHYVTGKELADWALEAQEAERQIMAGDTTFGPSDHCKFCPANPHSRGDKGSPLCPAMLQILYPSPEPDIDELLED